MILEIIFLQHSFKLLILLLYFFKTMALFACFVDFYMLYYMYMKIKQLIKMVKADTKKFLKSKDGKNYIQLIKKENGIEHLIYAKGVN
jgi:hypothetical protein